MNQTTSRVMWFSRHPMTAEQAKALVSRLGSIEVTQINGTAPNVHVPFDGEVNGTPVHVEPLKVLVDKFDVIAVVMPIGLLQQLKPHCGEKPLIMALNTRVFSEGEKVTFKFDKWESIDKVEIVKSDF